MTPTEPTRESIKRMLHSYRDTDAEIRQLLAEMQRVTDRMAGPGAQNMDGMPRSSDVGKPVESMALCHLSLWESYREKVAQLSEAQSRIENLIEQLAPIERRLVRLRYIDGLSWEAVCVELSYSWRQTHRIHSDVLDRLLEIEKERGVLNG